MATAGKGMRQNVFLGLHVVAPAGVLVMHMRRDGQMLAQVRLALPAADPDSHYECCAGP
jgi:hypothetical protein